MSAEQLAALLASLLPMVLIFAVMYMILILPQRKKEKKTRTMLNSVKVGDDIVTVGGVIGKVVNIKDDDITIETGVMKTKILFKRWAIKEVVQVIEA